MQLPDKSPDTEIKFCLYARKSSESDERQAISIDSQVKEMMAIAKRDNLTVENIYEESHSAKKCAQRPIFSSLMAEIENGKYTGILTWAPDRLSRNAGDLGQLVDLMDENKLRVIVTYSQTFTNNPNEKFLLMILGSQGKLENDNRSVNIKRGIRTQCELGYWPGQVPLGYISKTIGSERKILIDPKRSPIIAEAFQKVADGLPVKNLIDWINKKTMLRTRNGKLIPDSVVYTILRNTFYYSKFSYGGVEYAGNYKPLITKELFQEVQTRLRPFRNTVSRAADKFSLNRFLKCSLCGSPIHRQNKIKKLVNGNTRFHVYYKCSQQMDTLCKARYVSEENIIREIAETVDMIDLSQINFPDYIQDEITRFERMRWDIFARMSENSIKLSIYPMKFDEIDETTIKMYLRNMILYAKPDKRYYLISALLKELITENLKSLTLKGFISITEFNEPQQQLQIYHPALT